MGAAARLFEEFAKTNKAFELKAAAFEGNFIKAQKLALSRTSETKKKRYYALQTFFKPYFEIGPPCLQRFKRKTSQKPHKLNSHIIQYPFELFSWL